MRLLQTFKSSLSSLATSNSLGTNSSGASSKSLLAHNPHTTNQQYQSLETKHDSQSNHGANNAIDNRAESITAGLLALSTSVAAARRGRRRSVGSTSASAVTAGSAPSLSAADAELVHGGDEIGPWDDFLAAAEERVSNGFAVSTSSAIVEQEANRDIAGGREWRSRGVGNKLKSHGRSVINHAEEVAVDTRQVGETEERREGCIGAELDVELALALSGNGGVEPFDNLGSEDFAGDGTHVVGRVVSEAPFVSVGQIEKLGKDIRSEDVRVIDGGIVDLGNMDQIVDCTSHLASNMNSTDVRNLLVYAFLKLIWLVLKVALITGIKLL